MSRSPSSKIANRPQGPAPTITASVENTSSLISHSKLQLELFLGHPHPEPVERIGHFDLAGQPALLAHVEGEVEHVLFHRISRAGLFEPVRLDIDMTGGAGAGAAAIGVDARDHVLDRGLHDRHSRLAIDGLFGAIVLDECYLRHSGPLVGYFAPRLFKVSPPRTQGMGPLGGSHA